MLLQSSGAHVACRTFPTLHSPESAVGASSGVTGRTHELAGDDANAAYEAVDTDAGSGFATSAIAFPPSDAVDTVVVGTLSNRPTITRLRPAEEVADFATL
jgi:hypothetical protein